MCVCVCSFTCTVPFWGLSLDIKSEVIFGKWGHSEDIFKVLFKVKRLSFWLKSRNETDTPAAITSYVCVLHFNHILYKCIFTVIHINLDEVNNVWHLSILWYFLSHHRAYISAFLFCSVHNVILKRHSIRIISGLRLSTGRLQVTTWRCGVWKMWVFSCQEGV